MKSKHILALLFAVVAFAAIAFFGLTAHAQTVTATIADTGSLVATPPPAIVGTAETITTPFIVTFAQTHAWLVTLISIIGGLRLVAKPIVSVVEIWVKNSPSTTDDAEVTKVEASLAYKIVAWLLDFGASIKVGPQFTATPKS